MSSVGWTVLREIDALEAAELERLRCKWWERYADRLTPTERAEIKDGNYSPITRPYQPTWANGAELEVTPALWVRLGKTRFIRRGVYLTQIDKAIDNRGGGRATGSKIREPLHEITTLVSLQDGQGLQPEYQRVPHSEVKRLPSTLRAQVRYAEQQVKDTERRLRRSLIDDLRRSDFTAAELEVIRAAVESVREGRVAA